MVPSDVALRRRVRSFAVLLVLALLGRAPVYAQARFSDEAEELHEVLTVLRERFSLMPSVAAYKWKHQQPVFDGAREESLLARTGEEAETLGLSGPSVRALFSVQMRLARAVQERAMERFDGQGLGATPLVDLHRVLRPRLERIGQRLLHTLALVLPSLQAPNMAERYAEQAARMLADVGLSAVEAHELLLALADVRVGSLPHKERVLARKVLRVGTTGDYAPFSVERGGVLLGSDISLVQSFARSLGVSVRFVRTSWPTLMQDYERGAFDLAASGISMTLERSAVAAFSLPYHRGGKTAIARCRQKQELDTLAEIDRPEVQVIVNPGGTNEAFAKSQLRKAKLRVFSDNRAVFDEIVSGRADVMITDDVEVALQARRHPSLCRTTRELFMRSDKAWLVQRGSELGRTIDEWLEPRIKSGMVQRALSRALALPP